METKSCFICCTLMLLVLSSTNVHANEDSRNGDAKFALSESSSQPIRAKRGFLKSALKGAAIGAAAGGIYHFVKKG
uniref:Uncharacterized protein n=1 Tax=Panagrolaimus sp. ES5 TaxID=591445 RepID=A0AC34FCS3_9BILA